VSRGAREAAAAIAVAVVLLLVIAGVLGFATLLWRI
jgi:hypothetical protein